jgi:outer membrane protein assembly factor BamA
MSFLRYSSMLGSDNNLTMAVVDGRLFRRPFAEKQTLAMQVYGQLTLAGKPPFNQYALLGNESLLRGYYTGRFRDRQFVGAQAEYRWLPLPFSKRVGFAAFAAAGQVGNALEDIRLSRVKWSVGGGPRYLLLPKIDIFMRLEAAFTQEGPGFYLFLGEAF